MISLYYVSANMMNRYVMAGLGVAQELDGGKSVRVKDFGNNLSRFKKRVKRALG